MFQNNLLMAAAAAASGTSLVSVGKSALFDGNTEYLDITNGTPTSTVIWSFSFWFYRAGVGGANQYFVTDDDGGYFGIQLGEAGEFEVIWDGSSNNYETTGIFYRDSGWYHAVVATDTSQALAANRLKVYINGKRVTMTNTNSVVSLNETTGIGTDGSKILVGTLSSSGPRLGFQGYMAETIFIDGIQSLPTDFGEYDSTGLFWTPKSSDEIKALTFGNNGFYLDNTTNAQTDASGNGNNLTNNNTVTLSTHTPTNYTALLNPLYATNGSLTYSNGNRSIGPDGAVNEMTCATLAIPPNSGKWYFDVSWNTWADAFDDGYIGIALGSLIRAGMSNPTSESNTWNIYMTDPIKIILGDGSAINTTQVFSQIGDIFQVAYDSDTGKLFLGYYDASATAEKWFSGDGTATAGDPSAGSNPTVTLSVADRALPLFPFAGIAGNSGQKFTVNFEEDEFARTAPTGFKALTTTNLAAQTTRTAADTTKYFDTILYEGNGNGQKVGQFQPFTDVFTVGNSALFNEANADHLKRTPAGAGSLVTWTISTWVKRGKLGISCYFIGTNDGGKNMTFGFGAANNLYWQLGTGDSWNGPNTVHMKLQTTQLYEDPSQWMHVVLKYDSTASTPSASGIALYVDGVQIENLAAEVYPAQNYASGWNSANEMLIGAVYNTETDEQNMDGYLAETVFIDGQALTPSSFAQTDTSTNRWVPKAVTGLTFGTNGFYLNYADGNDLGDDESGNTNDWTEVNLDTTNKSNQFYDTPTRNFATMDPGRSINETMSKGNLLGTSGGATGQVRTPDAMGVSSGKWYFEYLMTNGTTNERTMYITQEDVAISATQIRSTTGHYSGYYSYDGNAMTPGDPTSTTGVSTSYGNTYTSGDVISCALDLDIKAIWWGKNGTWQNSATEAEIEAGNVSNAAQGDLANGEWYPTMQNNATFAAQMNFGQHIYFDGTALSKDTTADGYFRHSVPDGFKAIQVDNFTASGQFISAFSWIKNRDATDNHMLFDRVRGITKDMHSNSATAEVTNVETLQNFLSGGIEIGNNVEVNTANESYVLWNWMMETTGGGASNTAGSINTEATLVDTTLGLSISKFDSGSAGDHTIGHGLGVAPEVIIFKDLESANNWGFYHSGAGFTDTQDYLLLNSDAAKGDNGANMWGSAFPTSTVFGFTSGQICNVDKDCIAYCFAPSQFISIGAYVGNGNVDGALVPTLNSVGIPIQPVFLLYKDIGNTNAWCIVDTKRSPSNVGDDVLFPAGTDVEQTNSINNLDIVTGGLKFRTTYNRSNGSSYNYIYIVIGTPIIDTDGRIIAGK